MRTDAEIRDLVETLERFNAAAVKRMSSDDEGQDYDGDCDAFNNNSKLLCALRWVMGEDTIKVPRAPTPLQDRIEIQAITSSGERGQ